MSTIAENVPPMQFTPNAKATAQYRKLGLDEIVQEGDVFVDGGLYTPASCYGHRVSQDDQWDFYRPIQQAQQEAQKYATGAKRSPSQGRGRFDLLPYWGLMAAAQRFEYGVERFGANNWRKGMPMSRLLSSMRRHAMQISEDDAEDHVGAVLFNALVFAHQRELIAQGKLPKELDDVTPDSEL